MSLFLAKKFDMDDEKSLMSDFDDEEIGVLVPSRAVEEDVATGGLKRPRSPSPPPPSQTLFEGLRGVNKASEEEEDEEEEDEDAPKKKKRRLKNLADKELGREDKEKKKESVSLMDDLFGDEEPSFEEEEKAPKKNLVLPEKDERSPSSPLPADDDKMLLEGEAQPEGPIILVDDERILPGVGGSGEIVEVHCVFAEDTNALGWTPVTSTTPAIDQRLQKLSWGIFMRRAHDPKEAKGNRWFIVLAPDRLMRCLGSPFFYSRVALVRVDSKSVTVEDDAVGSPAIYYAYHLMGKEPIWRGAWTIGDLITLALDTLYAHVEDTCKRRKTHDVIDIIKQTLRSVQAFPISHKDPIKLPLAPPQVPLTTVSPRKNRKETLKEIWEKPFMVKVPTIQWNAVDTSGLAQCQRGFHVNVNYFFADLEKPSTTWSKLVDSGHFDCVTLCEMTHWGRSTVFNVHAVIKQIAEGLGMDANFFSSEGSDDTTLTVTGLGTQQRHISEERFLQMATLVPLNLDWFSFWFDAYFDNRGTREDRLRYYAIFCASEIIHDFYEQSRLFGPISSGFIFTKARQERLFKSGAQARGPYYEHRLALENISPPDSIPPADVLQDDEHITVRENIVRFLDRFAKDGPKLWQENQLMQPPRPLILRNGRSSRDQERILVDLEVDEVGRRLASLTIQMALRWRKLIKPDSPLRGLPPLFVEFASIYGPSSVDKDLEEFYHSLYGLMSTSSSSSSSPPPEVLLLRPPTPGYDPEQSLRHAKKQASNKSVIRALVLDSFHLWHVEQLTSLLATLKEAPNILAECTHLIVTGRAHTLSESAGGGNYAWELLEVAQRLIGTLNIDSSTTIISSLPTLNRFSRTQGDLSAQLYSQESREEQYLFNRVRVQGITAKEAISTICVENRQRGNGRSPTVLVLSAMQRTQILLKRMWLQADDSMVSGPRATVSFATYQAFARLPSSFTASYSYVIFADARYSGKGRFTYHHINASFERATNFTFILAEPGERNAEALENFRERFLHNDARTDGLNMHIGRSNLLTAVFEQLIRTPSIANKLKE